MATTLQFDIIARDLASRTFNKIGARSGILSKSIAGFGAVATGALKGAGLALGAFSVAAAKTGLQTAAALERAQISFTEFTGSAETATKLISDLKKFTLKTPFDLPGLTQTATRLLGVGVSAKQLIPTIAGLGDTAAAFGLSGEQFNRVTLAISQSLAKGRFAAEEFNQVSEAGIPILKILSRALGKPVPELLKLSRQGDLLSKDIFPKLLAQMQKDYGGSMSKQVSTLTGLWSNLMDAFRLGASDAIQPLIPLIKDGLAGATANLTENFGKVKNALATVTPLVVAFVNGLRGGTAGGGGPIVQATEAGQKFAKILGDMGDAAKRAVGPLRGLFTDLGPIVGDVAQTFSGLGPKIVKALANVPRDVATVFADIASAAAKSFSAILTAIAPIAGKVAPTFGMITAKLAELAPAIGKIIIEVGKFAAAIITTLAPAFGILSPVISSVISLLSTLIQFVADHTFAFGVLASAVLGALAAYKALQVVTAIITTIRKVTLLWAAAQFLINVALTANPIGIVVVALGALVAGLIFAYKNSETFRNIVNGALSAVVKAARAVGAFFSGPFVRPFVEGFATIKAQVSTNIAKVVTLFRNLPSRARSALSKIGSAIKKPFVDAWNATRKFVNEQIAKLVAAVRALPGKAKAALGNIKAKLRQAGRDLISGMISGIADKARALVSKAKGVVNDAIQGAKNLLHISSPSKVFEEIGRQTVAGFELGLDRSAVKLGRKLPKMLNPIVAPTIAPMRSSVGGTGGAAPASTSTVHLTANFHGPVGSQQQMNDWLSKSLDTLRRQGRLKSGTG